MFPKTTNLFLVSLALSATLAFAQTSHQKQLAVTVLDAHLDPSQPVPSAKVSLGYIDGSSRITDALDVTNPHGQAWLLVSPALANRSDLRLEVTGLSNLVIYEPADGQLSALPSTITLKLLPKGSPLLANPAQLEAMINRLSQSNSKLKNQTTQELKQIKGLQSQLAQAQSESQKQDLNAALNEWATNNGLSLPDVQKKIQEWAQNLQSDPAASAERKALAAFALKNYAQAAELFGEANDDEMAQFQAQKKQQQEQNLAALTKILNTSKQRANSLQLIAHYHDATAALLKTRDYLALQHKSTPDDAAIRDLWLSAIAESADARRAEGEFSAAGESNRLLTLALDDYRSLQSEYSAINNRQGIAAALLGLGNVLRSEGERGSGDNALPLFDQAVQAYQNALEIFTEAVYPQEWASTQVSLGNTLIDEITRGKADNLKARVELSIQAFRSALKVFNKVDYMQDWAKVQIGLGRALTLMAKVENQPELQDQAEQAYRSTLDVLNKSDQPQYWARTQMHIGDLLLSEVEQQSSMDESLVIADKSIQAFRSALEVFTKADSPQEWALVEEGLGGALQLKGDNSHDDDETMEILDQSLQALHSAQEVFTKSDMPQYWARLQQNIAGVLFTQASYFDSEKAIPLYEQSIEYLRSSLDIFTKSDMPTLWASIQMSLGTYMCKEGLTLYDKRRLVLMNQSIEAFRNALDVMNRTNLPQTWAMIHFNIGGVLKAESDSGLPDKDLLAQSVKEYRNALEVWTKKDQLQSWAYIQQILGKVLLEEAEESSEKKESSALLDQAIQALQNAQEVYTEKDNRDTWQSIKFDLNRARELQAAMPK